MSEPIRITPPRYSREDDDESYHYRHNRTLTKREADAKADAEIAEHLDRQERTATDGL